MIKYIQNVKITGNSIETQDGLIEVAGIMVIADIAEIPELITLGSG